MSAIIGDSIAEAAEFLKKGKLVAIPTETVYGLAANALQPETVIKIFQAKNRPLFDPLILHVASFIDAQNYCENIPDIAFEIATRFSPGPLTFLLPRKKNIPDLITSGLPKVAVRIPNHQLTLELLRKLEFPLAAPSANPFGYISPTSAVHVYNQLKDKIDYILDGGECKIGIESTIVEFEENKIIVHRLGGLSVEELSPFGKIELRLNKSGNPSAPGQLKTHYSPRKPLLLGDINQLSSRNKDKKIGILSFTQHYPGKSLVLSKSGDFNEAAKNLFSHLRFLDESDVELIIAEPLPDTFLGRAINDRLERASVTS